MIEARPIGDPNPGDGSTRRQRWMLYVVYAETMLWLLGVIIFVATLDQTRRFLGDGGIEYCWMYGSFNRYLFTHLALIFLNVAALVCLHQFARRDRLLAYLMLQGVWLLWEPVLAFFNMSYC